MYSKYSRRRFLATSGQVASGLMVAPAIPIARSYKYESIQRSGMKVGVDADKLYAVKNDGPFPF